MFASLFQECGFHKVPLDEEFFISMLHGPSSISSPMEDEQPGPEHRKSSAGHVAYLASLYHFTSIDPHHYVVFQRLSITYTRTIDS